MTASLALVKTGRDALYVRERGIVDLPIAYFGMAAFSLPVAFGMLWLIRVAGPRRARAGAFTAITAVLVVFGRIAQPPGGGARMTALFVAVPLLFGVLFAVVWLLAAELFDGLPQERISCAYARIGAGSIAGGLLGGVGARTLAPAVPPEAFFGICAVVLGASAGLVVLRQARHAPQPVAGDAIERPSLGRARSFLRRRYGALLLGVGVLVAIVGVLIEFQFYWAASTSGAGGRNQSLNFANRYLLLNTAALAVTTRLLTPWIHRSHPPGDPHEVSSLPPGGCVVTATLGGIVQRSTEGRFATALLATYFAPTGRLATSRRPSLLLEGADRMRTECTKLKQSGFGDLMLGKSSSVSSSA